MLELITPETEAYRDLEDAHCTPEALDDIAITVLTQFMQDVRRCRPDLKLVEDDA